ncbi:MAG: phage capsid protein [Anderseniella sp.]
MPGAAPMIQYREEMVLAFGQRQSLLKDTTTKESQTKGNQATFLIVDSSGTTVTRGVGGLIPARDNNNTQTTVTLKEKHDLIEMTGFNIFQSQGDQREIMQINTMSVLNRDIDAAILAQLETGTITTGATATASLTMVQKATTYLMNNGVPWDGNVFAVISPAFLAYLMTIPTFSSADFVTVKPAVNYPGWNAMDAKTASSMGQGWYEWLGVKWIVSNQIAGLGSSSELCFMYHRNAVGHAADAKGMDVAIGYEDKQQLSWSRCSLYHEAKLLQNTGIVQMTHDGSAIVAS